MRDDWVSSDKINIVDPKQYHNIILKYQQFLFERAQYNILRGEAEAIVETDKFKITVTRNITPRKRDQDYYICEIHTYGDINVYNYHIVESPVDRLSKLFYKAGLVLINTCVATKKPYDYMLVKVERV